MLSWLLLNIAYLFLVLDWALLTFLEPIAVLVSVPLHHIIKDVADCLSLHIRGEDSGDVRLGNEGLRENVGVDS